MMVALRSGDNLLGSGLVEGRAGKLVSPSAGGAAALAAFRVFLPTTSDHNDYALGAEATLLVEMS